MRNNKLLALLVAGFCAYAARTQAQQAVIEKIISTNLINPFGVAVDSTNLYYVTDSANHRIVRYDPDTGKDTTLAGIPGLAGNDDDARINGVFGTLSNPQGIVLAGIGLVVADSGNHAIRLVNLGTGLITTIAGNKSANGGYADGIGTAALFNAPYGLAVSRDGNSVYVADLGNNAIRKLDLLTYNVTTVIAPTVASNRLFRPYSVAVDDQDRLFVADLGNHCIKMLSPIDGSLTIVAGSPAESGDATHVWGPNARFASPSGLLWAGNETGLLVCDLENHNLRRLYYNTNYNRYSVETYPADETQANAVQSALISPISMAKDASESILIVDNGANALFRIPSSQSIQPPVSDPVIGIVRSTPYTNALGVIYFDTLLTPVVNATLINEVVVAIRCDDQQGVRIFYTMDGSDPSASHGQETIPFVTGDPIPAPGLIGAVHNSNVVIKAIAIAVGRKPSKVVAASFNYRVSPPSVIGDDASNFTVNDLTDGALLYYTTDGSEPTTNTASIIWLNALGMSDTMSILNGTNDVTLRILATKLGYTSVAITKTFLFENIRNNSAGVPRDFLAGAGSTIVVPVVVKIGNGKPLRSMQFLVEVTPLGNQDPIPAQFRLLDVDPAIDFIKIVTPAASGTALGTYSPYSYTNNGKTIRGLAISFIGSNANFVVNDYATVAMLALPVPGTAAEGERYSISIKEPTGTIDAQQTPARIISLADRFVTVSNLSYTVGDSAMANWYNAGDFGNTNLANNDVNNAFYASLGVRVPFSFSDVFDAMDTFPTDTTSSVGGDGQIRFLDWQILLMRSLRLDTNNWTRKWSAGKRISQRLGQLNNVPLTAGEHVAAAGASSGGNAWNTQAAVGVHSLNNAAPGQSVTLPVYLKVNSGANIAGLQFRALVIPENGAPALTTAAYFSKVGALPSPWTVQDLPANQIAAGWPIVSGSGLSSLNLQGDNVIGFLKFQVPATATAGQYYSIHFANADGAASLSQQSLVDAVAGTVGVLCNAPSVSGPTDGWKNFFFGSFSNPMADGDANPTGDGFSNLAKWLSGFDPSQYLAKYGLSLDNFANHQFALRWTTKAGVTYLVEKSTDLIVWTPVDNISGNDLIKTYMDAKADGQTMFYRVREVGSK